MRFTITAVSSMLLLASCSRTREAWVELQTEPRNTPTLSINGTVQHLQLEGGLYVIRDAQGTQYNPTNLPQSFRVAGIAVEAVARRRDDVASIGMVGPMVELLRIRRRGDSPPGLPGTSWRLEDLAGAGVVDRVQATLSFAEDFKVSGNGSCNRFTGSATVSGATIKFTPLAATRMACAEAVMNQETRYMSLLQSAERFEIKDSFLYLFASGNAQPLRFVRARE